MPLDLTHISRQIEQLSAGAAGKRYQQDLEMARELLRVTDPEQLRAKYQERRRRRDKIPWLEAYVPSTLTGAFDCPPLPRDFGVAAADGSSIPPDRHSPVRFCAINIGCVWLQYGSQPDAQMSTSARLYDADALQLTGDDGDYTERELEGSALEAKRAVDELCALWDVCQGRDLPLAALSDGQLTLWPLEGEPLNIRRQLLAPFFGALDRFREARIPVAAYISHPSSRYVVNALRTFVCQDTPIHCTQCRCLPDLRMKSLALKRLRDYQLLNFLAPGQRSEVFEIERPILKDYGAHTIQFFYLNSGDEIACIEAPQWVMRDAELLNRTHAIIYDQCRRSGVYPPYPPVLQEAHEQAVIPTGDRRVVEQMVEEALQQQGIVYMRGAKDHSKRMRVV
ncbi:MAG: DNA double-strand break repair nuclease NurA [Chloroflexi bacterium]|nr:DNA double-strand break repair nuclease NurA [Chloroflexota bacterium]